MKAQGEILRRMWGASGPQWGKRPDDYDPQAVEQTVGQLGRLFRRGGYFDTTWEGFEKVPPPPVMVVSNHSGGTTIPDAWGLMTGWYRQFGTNRPLYVMGHEIIFSNSVTGPYFARRGVLSGNPAICERALREGHDVLVLPGGDLEVWRPYKRRYQVEFNGRRGYARTAVACDVPVVPVAHSGAHETLRVLTDGRELARLLRLPQLVRASIWPIHLSLPWILGVGPLPHFPLPARFRYRVADPIRVTRLDEAVRSRIQSLLDILRAQD